MYFMKFLIFLLTTACCQAIYFERNDYCKLPCNYGFQDITHLICERKGDCSVDRQRCPGYERVPMTDKIKRFILDEHNKLRNKIAMGEERRGLDGAQPQASNMMALKYNDELGYVAQCWANTCQPSTHSKCHRSKNLPFAGQNLAYRKSTVKNFDGNLETSIKKMIHAWFDEVELFSPSHIRPYKFVSGTGHYTLMVWGDIQEVGCGLIRFREGMWYTISIVCNYGSTKVAGNIINKEMYTIGNPASDCPPHTRRNPKYHGLCGYDTLDMDTLNQTVVQTFYIDLDDVHSSEITDSRGSDYWDLVNKIQKIYYYMEPLKNEKK